MNVSVKHKTVWWAPPRTATRALSELLGRYSFYNYEESPPTDINCNSYTHSCKVPQGFEGYDLITQIRNPYSWAVSSWYLKYSDEGVFNESYFIEKFSNYLLNNNSVPCDFIKDWTSHKGKKILIRYEHLKDDVKHIPFIDFNDPVTKEIYERSIVNNIYTSSFLRRTVDNTLSESKFYYTEELAEIIYNKYRIIFDMFNYPKNSWKQ